MLKSACNCCQQFPIDVVTLQARQKGASFWKCGTNVGNPWEDGYFPSPDGQYYQIFKVIFSADFGVYPVLNKVNVETGEMTPWTSGTIEEIFEYSWNAETCSCDFSHTGFVPEDYGSSSATFDWSNVYTDTMLLENTVACIGEYGEWQNLSPFPPTTLRGFYNLAFTDTPEEVNDSYSEQLIEVRITHPPTATGYLKVWLWKGVSTYNGVDCSTSTWSLFDTYEWEGEPNDLNFGINEPENLVTSDTFTVPRPDLNTCTKIIVAKWSLIKDYEPDDPLSVDEFDLSGVVINRPTTDCKSNGVPALSAECPA